MKIRNHKTGWATAEAATLTKEDLKEGRIYSIPFLSKDGVIKVNQCLYAVINGEILIHRSANWEDVSREDLRAEAFLKESDLTIKSLPADLSCFIDLEKIVL